jgi:preprotein translocase subunit SecD
VRRFKGFGSLIAIVLLAVVGLAYTFVAGNSPLLGLDLQGGVSVVLKPTNEVSEDTLEQSISIIRQRIDALGVAEPEITRQGTNILIQIPGVKDRDRALALVGQTAELQFRPVLSAVATEPDPSQVDPGAPTSTTVAPDASTTSVAPSGTDTTAEPSSTTDGSGEQGLGPASPAGPALGVGESAQGDATTTTPPTIADPATTDPSVVTDPTVAPPSTLPPGAGLGQLPEDVCSTGLPASDLPADQPVTVPQCEDGELVATYVVGPVALTGRALSGASAGLSAQTGEWLVNPTFKSGAEGIDLFNAVAGQCYAGQASCPSGQLAIVLDGRVISAPAIQTPSFAPDQITISGTFTERTANDLATSLKYGALPVELEQQQAQLVSATLGRDALHAGLVAGIVGLALAAAYMLAFYRFLGFVALIKLAIEGALLWVVVAYLGTNNGLALTLAGITGIIVSIGVSMDSNVVYYEHLKEDVRNGRTIRSATDKSFVAAFSTIVKADVASLIGAGLLWWLTVGPVRGFAFYLGLAGLLDLLCSWAFMRPAAKLATRSRFLLDRPKLLGLPSEQATAPSTARPPVASGAVR